MYNPEFFLNSFFRRVIRWNLPQRRLFRLAERPRKLRPGLFFLWARLGPPGTSQSRDIKYIGMDVHKEAIVIVVLNGRGKLVMETVVGTKASCILQVIHGLRGELHVSWEEGTWAAWLHDLLQPPHAPSSSMQSAS